jgi:hypothetical protein
MLAILANLGVHARAQALALSLLVVLVLPAGCSSPWARRSRRSSTPSFDAFVEGGRKDAGARGAAADPRATALA